MKNVLDELTAEMREVVQRVQDESEDASTTVDVDGVEVTATVTPGGETTVVAPAPSARDLSLKFYPEGFTSGLGKVFGAQDVEVGESRFDDRYMIKASDESLARLWLSHEVRKRISVAHPDEASGPFLVQLEAEQVAISWSGSHDAERLAAACRAAAALGDRGRALLEELRTIADELDGAVMGRAAQWWPGVSIVVRRGELEVLIDHVSIALSSRQPTLHTRFVVNSFVDNARRAVICRPNAQKRASRLVGNTLFERSTGDRDLSFHYWIGTEFARGIGERLDRETTKLLLEALPQVVVLEADEVILYHEGFLDLDDVVKLHRTLALAEALSGVPKKDTGRRGRRRRDPSGSSGPLSSSPRRPLRQEASKPSRSKSAQASTLQETWRRLAGAISGEYLFDGSIHADVDGTAVKIWESWGSEFGLVLHMEAEATGSEGLSLHVSSGSLDPLSSFLGVEDIEIGDRRFDEHHIIKANDLGFSKLWLSSRIRELIGGTPDVTAALGYSFEVNDAIVEVVRRPTERSPGRLEQAIRATAALGARGRTIVSEMELLAEELGGALIGSPEQWNPVTGVSMAIVEGDTDVTVGQSFGTTLTKRPTLLTHVHRARHGSSKDRYMVCKHDHLKRGRALIGGKAVDLKEFQSDDGHFNFLFWAGGENREALVWRLDERMLTRLVLAEPEAVIASSHEISLWFSGFVADLEQLRRVMKILDALGEGVVITGPAGPYR